MLLNIKKYGEASAPPYLLCDTCRLIKEFPLLFLAYLFPG